MLTFIAKWTLSIRLGQSFTRVSNVQDPDYFFVTILWVRPFVIIGLNHNYIIYFIMEFSALTETKQTFF